MKQTGHEKQLFNHLSCSFHRFYDCWNLQYKAPLQVKFRKHLNRLRNNAKLLIVYGGLTNLEMNDLDLLACIIPEITDSYRITAIVTLALMIPISVVTIFGNVLVIIVLVKNKRIQTQSNILLGSLCLADLLIGIIGQPIFITRRFLEIDGDVSTAYCDLQKIHIYFAYLGVGASITTLAIVSLDRWFAICRPFVYHEFQSIGKCMVVITVDWVLLMVLMIIPYIGLASVAIYIGSSIVMVISILTIIACYINIYIVMLRHKKQISQQAAVSQAEPSAVTNGRPAERRKTNTIAIIIATLFACYAPHIVTICIKSFTGRRLQLESRVCELIILMNSSINPIIYCLRSTEIKTAVRKVIQQIFSTN